MSVPSLTVALVATTAAQVLATLAVYVLPVLAPVAAPDLGVGPQLVGMQVAIIYGAASAASMGSGALLARVGPARSTQVALGLGALGLLAIVLGGLPGAALGSVFIGIGYGFTSPAATLVLSRITPPARRNLVFSIKQMGVPIGGALAGLLLPSLALLAGWHGATLAVAAALLAVMAVLQPLHATWDVRRGAATLAAPGALSVLRQAPGLLALAVMGASFSAVQLSLGAYAVTMLVGEFGWSPVAAGAAAAALQVSGAAARLVWAVLADWSRAGLLVLAGVGLATAGASLAMPAALHWPPLAVLVLLSLFGACTAGWTGVAMAEVARLAPPGLAGAATGGVMAITFGGVVVGPLVFAGLAALIGSYTGAFTAIAVLPAAGAAIAWRSHRQGRSRESV